MGKDRRVTNASMDMRRLENDRGWVWGILATDEETIHQTEVLLWARIFVKAEGRERPSTVNILSGLRSYELQIWWELPPWVARVFPSK